MSPETFPDFREINCNTNCLLTWLGPYCDDLGPIFPSTARASSVSKLFIKWHSVSDSKMPFRWLALKHVRLWNFGKISIFLASSGSFNVKSDNIHTFFRCFCCKFWICRLRFKTKVHGLDRFRVPLFPKTPGRSSILVLVTHHWWFDTNSRNNGSCKS